MFFMFAIAFSCQNVVAFLLVDSLSFHPQLKYFEMSSKITLV